MGRGITTPGMVHISAARPDPRSDNTIRNTKYTIFSFVPLILLQQFKSFSSVYFFMIMLAQLHPDLAITSFAASFFPWLSVLLISLFNEGFDDYKRYLRDCESNAGLYGRWTRKGLRPVKSSEIKAGDIIMIRKGQRVPADCVVLKVEDATGEVFIRTDQLDGETDWKQRIALPDTQSCPLEAMLDIRVVAEASHRDIYSFSASLELPSSAVSGSGSTADRDEGSHTATPSLLSSKPAAGLNPSTAASRKSVQTERSGEDQDVTLLTGAQTGPGAADGLRSTLDVSGATVQSFDAKVDVPSLPKVIGLSLENTVWANTVVATAGVLGLVVYTGNSTRSMMNTYLPRTKTGRLEKELDLVMLALAVLSGIAASAFTTLAGRPFSRDGLITLVRFLMLFSYVIPISLRVTLNLARFWYMRLLSKTPGLAGAIVRSSSLQEELGRVSYVLTDKTGTLTRNEMVMKKLHLGTVCYAAENTEEVQNLLAEAAARAARPRRSGGKPRHQRMLELFEALALCHTVMPVSVSDDEPRTEQGKGEFAAGDRAAGGARGNVSEGHSEDKVHVDPGAAGELGLGDAEHGGENGKVNGGSAEAKTQSRESPRRERSSQRITYQASSPDELAIVEYAVAVGYRLVKRDRAQIVISTPAGDRTYRILETFPFSSDTKRMGIIVEREIDKTILFFAKGADVAMRPILRESDWVEEETDNMARDGLRTLLIGRRILTRTEYETFASAYYEARCSVTSRAEKMLALQSTLEHGLEVLGLTGVEDRLQARVKESLENLRNAGIRVWMLTGDKIETAISIALSSRLLDKTDRYLVIAGVKDEKTMRAHLRALRSGAYNALVIDGTSLALVIDSFLDEFIEAARELTCLVGCRYSPTQKAVMAAALRKDCGSGPKNSGPSRKASFTGGNTVCCIGDGGNDVSMITEADVGIGIEGREGNQASLAADFSVKQFSQICDLLFLHGRLSYKNSATVAHLIIHRGTIISITQAIFSALVDFLPISLFQGPATACLICYTFFPLLAVIDSVDISPAIALRFPELYAELRASGLLSPYSFLVHNLNSFYQGAAIMFIFCREMTDLAPLGILVFATLIINEQIMVLLSIERITLLSILLCAFSMLLFILTALIVPSALDVRPMRGHILTVLFASTAAALLMLAQRFYRACIKPESHRKLGYVPG